jgi:hypothetical protein
MSTTPHFKDSYAQKAKYFSQKLTPYYSYPRILPFYNQGGYTEFKQHHNVRYARGYNYDSYPSQRNYNLNRSYRPNNYSTSKKEHMTVDRQLFMKLRDFGNNLYSICLMDRDLNINNPTPHVQKEIKRIISHLTNPQIKPKQFLNQTEHERNLNKLANDLIVANIKRSHHMYTCYKEELIKDIEQLLSMDIQCIPLAQKVFNYIKPGLQTRRLSKEVIKQVETELVKYISSLKITKKTNTLLNKGITPNIQDLPTLNTPRQDNSTSPVILTPTRIDNAFKEATTSHDSILHTNTMEVESIKANKKRKPERPVEISSSDDETTTRVIPLSNIHDTNIQIKTPAKKVCPQEKTIVKTVEESYINFATLIPSGKYLPKCKPPPQNPESFTLNRSDCSHINKSCQSLTHDTTMTSMITLTFDDQMETPQSHMVIKITKNSFKQDLINSLPQDRHLLYELFMTYKRYQDYIYPIKAFMNWCADKKHSFIITVPENHRVKVKALIDDPILDDINRPFQVQASVCSTG